MAVNFPVYSESLRTTAAIHIPVSVKINQSPKSPQQDAIHDPSPSVMANSRSLKQQLPHISGHSDSPNSLSHVRARPYS